jgi:hypothetical protein
MFREYADQFVGALLFWHRNFDYDFMIMKGKEQNLHRDFYDLQVQQPPFAVIACVYLGPYAS